MTDDAIRRLVDDPDAQPRIIRLRPGRMLWLTDEQGQTTGFPSQGGTG